MRANALEHTGQGQVAAHQIRENAAAHPTGVAWLAQVAAAQPWLGLCPQSLPAARRGE